MRPFVFSLTRRLWVVLVPLLLCGCVNGYNSRIEMMRAATISSSTVRSIKREVDTALSPMRFLLVFQNGASLRSNGKVAEWKLTRDRGLWWGEDTIVVTLLAEPMSIVINVAAEEATSRKEVRRVQEILLKVLGQKFPAANVRVKSGYDFTTTP